VIPWPFIGNYRDLQSFLEHCFGLGGRGGQDLVDSLEDIGELSLEDELFESEKFCPFELAVLILHLGVGRSQLSNLPS
jgi:hypothetical protein